MAGFWNWLITGEPMTPAALPQNLASPYGSPNELSPAIIIAGEYGQTAEAIVDESLALRVPEVNRALQAHQALVAPLKFELVQDGEPVAEQPFWVTGTESGIPPFIRWNGVVRDLFLYGAAVLGAELDSFGLPRDLLHIPFRLWDVNPTTGLVEADPTIPAKYRQRIIYIPLGSGGLLTDGVDSIRQARKLELARQARLDTPPAATELHLTDPKYDEMESVEKAALAKSYAANRNAHAVSVTPSYIEVKEHNGQAVDLFESGMNSLRLQLAMHSGVPASFLEAGKEGGSAGQMSYTNDAGKASELWVFGSARFAYAITARLSLDDVAGANAEVRANIPGLIAPTPEEVSAESPIAATSAPAPIKENA